MAIHIKEPSRIKSAGNKVKIIEAFISQKGETIQYTTPDPEGAEYLAVCLPAFKPNTVNHEE